MSLGACKSICGFPSCSGKKFRHQRARRRQFIRSLGCCGDICQVMGRRNGASVRIPPTKVHKCEPRAIRSSAKPHAVGTRLNMSRVAAKLSISKTENSSENKIFCYI
ncbi:hypothetical protein AVEN_98085-1 [Araneus ventricosus]|uniref:Uncharacterized protein n=1 Tax=Araneus ventricosus TaxID=182803 RepID=A0A4Y2UND1_ARAVE|nr:hypothetical protein AVEN_98085-1 [Araneus ventricosus]